MENINIYPFGKDGQLPGNIGLVNDMYTGGADSALTAEQGKIIGDGLFSTPVDLSGFVASTGIINSVDNWDSSGGTCIFLPVEPGKVYKLSNTDENNNSHNVNYSFLTAAGVGSQGTTPAYATGYSGRVIINYGVTILVTAPADAKYLYLRKTLSDGDYILPLVSLWDTNIAEKIKGAQDASSPLYEVKWSDLRTYTNIAIGTAKKWGSGIGDCMMLPIFPGWKYKVVQTTTHNAHIAILSQWKPGESTDPVQFATGWDDRVVVQRGAEPYVFTAPDDAVAMYIRLTDSQGNAQTPQAIYTYQEDYELLVATFNSAYNKTDVDSVVNKFCKLADGKDDIETFMFFTDPHLTNMSRYEGMDEFVRDKYISTLQRYYNSLPLDNCICGGDWLDNAHTSPEACAILGFVDGVMRKLFRNYRPILGNHDTNPYSGNGGSADWVNALTYKTVRNLMFRENKETYYSFDGVNTKFYMMNSGMSYVKTMTNSTYNQYIGPRWEQIAWLGNKLLTDDAANSIIAMHIYANADSEEEWFSDETGLRAAGIHEFGYNCKRLAVAYNNRESITLNGITYNFSACTGRVLFILCGHSHLDYVDTSGEIPIVCTTNLEGNYWDDDAKVTLKSATFDNCLCDLDNMALFAVRVGAGVSRIVNYSPKTVAVGSTISLTKKVSGTVTWASRDGSIATVSSGTVTGVAAGVVGIVATNEAGEEEYWIVKVTA